MKISRNLLGSIFLLLLALGIIIKPARPSKFTAQVGQDVDNITVTTGSGQRQTLGQVLDHHAGLLNFFATWCPACRMELPNLHSTVTSSDKLILLSQGSPSSTTTFLRQYGIAQAHSFYDPSGQVFTSFFVTTLPTSYFVNRYGIIVSKVVGPMTPTLLRENLRRANESRVG
ncbi:MAG: TlpA family protein disulfide reductase [Firmicutes bacterium]|nr:TlpA family protein disulfide reductase [Bacillota bacterium]